MGAYLAAAVALVAVCLPALPLLEGALRRIRVRELWKEIVITRLSKMNRFIRVVEVGRRVLRKHIVNGFYRFGSGGLARMLTKALRAEPAILMFHRVLPEEEARRDLTRSSVSVAAFDRLVGHLCEERKIVPLSALVDASSAGSLPGNLVSISFDDGYRDVAEFALPILKKYNAPAILYLLTSFPEMEAEIWWYSLMEQVLDTKRSAIYDRGGKIGFPLKDDLERAYAFRKLWLMFKESTHEQQEDLYYQYDIPKVRIEDYALKWTQIADLMASGLLEIGSHSHSHFNYAFYKNEEIAQDITKSCRLIKGKLGVDCQHFAYPYGKERQYKNVWKVVAGLGFRTAVTSEIRPFGKDASLFTLPRHALSFEGVALSRVGVRLSGWNALTRLQI